MFDKNKPFYLDDTPMVPGKYVLRINHEKAHCSGTEGSYGVLPARLLHMNYADFLRLCRDEFGATLVGKNCKYVVPYFTLNEKTSLLVEILNNSIKLFEAVKQYPDWEMYKRFVDEYYNQQAAAISPLTIEDIKEMEANE